MLKSHLPSISTISRLLVILSIIPGLSDANTELESDGLVWTRVYAPAGNLIWRRMEPEPDQQVPSLTITSPADMTTWYRTRSVNITWIATDIPSRRNMKGATTSQITTAMVRIDLYWEHVSPSRYVSAITHATPALTHVTSRVILDDKTESLSGTGNFTWIVKVDESYHVNSFYQLVFTLLDDESIQSVNRGRFRILNVPV